MKFKYDALYGGLWLLVTLLILIPVYAAGNYQGQFIRFLPVLFGVTAFTIFSFDILISLRPKGAERHLGLTRLYQIHGISAVIGLAAAAAHIYLRYDWGDPITTIPFLTGGPAFFFFFLAVLTGIFVLSTTFIKYSSFFTRLKEKKFRREFHVQIHRLSLIGLTLVYLHAMYFGFIRNNIVAAAVLTLCFATASLGWYFSKLRILRLPAYRVTAVDRLTDDIFKIELQPDTGKIFDYRAGAYVFLRLTKSALPCESHPFSLTSSPENRQSVSLMIKKSGDFTDIIGNVKAGDKATLEGPYGNLLTPETAASETPLVLLAGGIGVTPMISILHDQIDRRNGREIVLLWSASKAGDVFHEAYYREMDGRHSQFTLHIALSKEQKDGYLHGRLSQKHFEDNGIEDYFKTADFLICGPAPMMASVRKMLKENGVESSRIHLEEFSF